MHKRIIKFLKLSDVRLKWNDVFLLLLPVAIWFSYHPVISLGANSHMNFELSLTEIFLVLFAVTALPRIWRNRSSVLRNKAVWLVGVFVLWNTLSLAWTQDFLRGLLTTGLLWLLALTFCAVLSNKNLKKLLSALFKLLIISAVVMSVFAWLQVIVGTLSGTSEFLLCSGCVASQFGFARATGFAIEPQFFGNLLLVPILVLCYLKFKKPKSELKLNTLITFLTTTLFLTLSRGAIYAFAIGLLILLILHFKQLKKVLCTASLVLGGFIIALILQGVLAQINPNFHETFVGATTKTIHQLSLGIIDLRPPESISMIGETPAYNGYIEESTDIRLAFSQVAISTWSSSIPNVIIGTGIGSSGVAMNATHPDQSDAKEIVQNEFLEILLELGMIGLVIFITIVVSLFCDTHQHKWPWAILTAFLVQWFFFSGYPNALHIYLTLLMLFVINNAFRPKILSTS